jgi:hypothetical protein
MATAIAQQQTEHLTTDWPAEYKWRVIKRQNDGEKQSVIIIPGNEMPQHATIVGVMAAYKGRHFSDMDQMIDQYKNALDTGSVLTIIQRADSAANPWVIFKIETPKNFKYPEPESDLYFVTQGRFAVFEDHVAIKEASLPGEFTARWSEIFKGSKLVKD